jgi:hypothetical protein
MGPLEELRTAVEAAAAELRNGKPSSAVRPTLERPKKQGFGDYSTNAAMLLAPALGAPPRQIAERLAGELSGRLGERVERVEVAGPGLPQRLPRPGLVRRRAGGPAGGRRRVRRRVARDAREGADRVRLRQPDGPADRRPPAATPRSATRWPGSSSRPATPSPASTTSTTPAPRSTASASRSAPAPAARRCRRTATRATTWSSWRGRSPARPTRTSASWPPRASRRS